MIFIRKTTALINLPYCPAHLWCLRRQSRTLWIPYYTPAKRTLDLTGMPLYPINYFQPAMHSGSFLLSFLWCHSFEECLEVLSVHVIILTICHLLYPIYHLSETKQIKKKVFFLVMCFWDSLPNYSLSLWYFHFIWVIYNFYSKSFFFNEQKRQQLVLLRRLLEWKFLTDKVWNSYSTNCAILQKKLKDLATFTWWNRYLGLALKCQSYACMNLATLPSRLCYIHFSRNETSPLLEIITTNKQKTEIVDKVCASSDLATQVKEYHWTCTSTMTVGVDSSKTAWIILKKWIYKSILPMRQVLETMDFIKTNLLFFNWKTSVISEISWMWEILCEISRLAIRSG